MVIIDLYVVAPILWALIFLGLGIGMSTASGPDGPMPWMKVLIGWTVVGAIGVFFLIGKAFGH